MRPTMSEPALRTLVPWLVKRPTAKTLGAFLVNVSACSAEDFPNEMMSPLSGISPEYSSGRKKHAKKL